MKKALFIIGIFLLGIGIGGGITTAIIGLPEKEDDFVLKVRQEKEKYEEECFAQTFPADLNTINIYNDEMKELDYNYHQCLKKIITSKLNELANKEDTNKMINSIDKFEDSILNFYWDLYNREDFGVIGRDKNDAVMGRYYEKLLEDIIHFQRLHPRPHSYPQN